MKYFALTVFKGIFFIIWVQYLNSLQYIVDLREGGIKFGERVWRKI